jgi:hypothetical protein
MVAGHFCTGVDEGKGNPGSDTWSGSEAMELIMACPSPRVVTVEPTGPSVMRSRPSKTDRSFAGYEIRILAHSISFEFAVQKVRPSSGIVASVSILEV